jgi:hypothetical protein
LKVLAFLKAVPLSLSMPLAVASVHRAAKYFFHGISITTQRFDAILSHNCFVRNDSDLGVIPAVLVWAFDPLDLYYRR